tara:strand:- start:539 stop:1015 length:477 start_codon:yes stop_codon:yes gene_type:complete
METTINRNTSLHIQQYEFKTDRDRILDILKNSEKSLSASEISRITRQSNNKNITVQSARSRLNELKNSYLIQESESSVNHITGLKNTSYKYLTRLGSISVIEREITLYKNNVNLISSDIETMKNMMFVSDVSIELLEKKLQSFKAVVTRLYKALNNYK